VKDEINKLVKEIELVETPEAQASDSLSPALALPSSGSFRTPEEIASLFTVQSPAEALKRTLLKAGMFTGISLFFFFLPFIAVPTMLDGFNYPYVRTALTMLLIWNLIGAALFAHAQTRLARMIAIGLFGSPLAIGCWLLGLVCFLAPMLHGRYPGF